MRLDLNNALNEFGTTKFNGTREIIHFLEDFLFDFAHVLP